MLSLPLRRPDVLLACMALAACSGGNGESDSAALGTAVEDVAPGTISDAMPVFDRVEVQEPPPGALADAASGGDDDRLPAPEPAGGQSSGPATGGTDAGSPETLPSPALKSLPPLDDADVAG